MFLIEIATTTTILAYDCDFIRISSLAVPYPFPSLNVFQLYHYAKLGCLHADDEHIFWLYSINCKFLSSYE
jgi:hypothetical protein